MDYAIIQSKDDKTKNFKEYAKINKLNLVENQHSPILMPLIIVKSIITKGKPTAVIFRYLNGYPSISKDFLRTLSEIISILLCKVSSIRILWICHNVDRESEIHHERVTMLRRKIFEKSANKILVTDPLLVKKAEEIFPLSKEKIDFITFGKIIKTSNEEKSHKLTADILNYIKQEKTNSKFHQRIIFGLCVGSANWKTGHFETIPKLMEEAEKADVSLKMIVVGPISNYYAQKMPSLVSELDNNKNIFFVDEFIPIQEEKITAEIDFYWRVYRDFSTPLTVYHSASNKKPIVTQNKGLLSELVLNHSLGFVVLNDFSNLREVFDNLKKWDSNKAEVFLSKQNWEVGTEKLVKNIRQ